MGERETNEAKSTVCSNDGLLGAFAFEEGEIFMIPPLDKQTVMRISNLDPYGLI